MNNKRGVSAVVATVLIILITVAAVTIIWAVILPLISQSVDLGEFGKGVSVVSSSTYTAYDSTPGAEKVSVQVSNSGSEDLEKVRVIIFTDSGGSYSEEVIAPEQGKVKTYFWSWPYSEKPVKVSVLPISSSGKEGNPSSEVNFKMLEVSDGLFGDFGSGGIISCSGSPLYVSPLDADCSSDYSATLICSNAIDGLFITNQATDGWYSEEYLVGGSSQTIVLDLGSVGCIEGIRTIIESYYGSHTDSISLSVSSDNVEWFLVNENLERNIYDSWDENLFNGVLGRYILLEYYGEGPGKFAQLEEIEVYFSTV